MLRQYNNAQGSWMSPDPYDGSYNPTNPQSFNRYGYVFNNPVSYLDSSGLDCDATTGVGCGDDDSDDQTIYVINGVAFGPGTCSMSDMSCQISISTYYLTNNSYFAAANLGSMHAPNNPQPHNYACKAKIAGLAAMAGAGSALGVAPPGSDPAGDAASAVKDAAGSPFFQAAAGYYAARLGSAVLSGAGAARLGAFVSEDLVPAAGWAAAAYTIYSAGKEAISYYNENAGICQ